jgi:hypothetical protein
MYFALLLQQLHFNKGIEKGLTEVMTITLVTIGFEREVIKVVNIERRLCDDANKC